MNVSHDELFRFLLSRCIELEAKVSVLQATFLKTLEILRPGSSDDFSKSLPSLYESSIREILLEHPYGDISELNDLLNPPE